MDDQRVDRKRGGIAILYPSIGRLIASATSIVVGVVIILCVLDARFADLVGFTLWLVGGIAVGAGLFAPFRLTIYGAFLGFVVQVILLIAIFVNVVHGLGGLRG